MYALLFAKNRRKMDAQNWLKHYNFQSEKSFDKLDKLDQSDLYTMYKKLQQQLEFLNVQEEYIKVCFILVKRDMMYLYFLIHGKLFTLDSY